MTPSVGSRDGGVSNGGLQYSSMSLPTYKYKGGSSVYTIQNGIPHGTTTGQHRLTSEDRPRTPKNGGISNPVESQLSSRASSVETLAIDQTDGLPNYDWLTFAPKAKKESRRRRKAKPPQTLILPRPVSFPSAIVVTQPSPEGMRQSELFVVESPPSCEEVASFMSGTGVEPLSTMVSIDFIFI